MSLLLHLPFNNENDFSNHGLNNCKLVNVTSSNFVNGLFGKCLTAKNGIITSNCKLGPVFNSKVFSISCWMKFTEFPVNTYFVLIGDFGQYKKEFQLGSWGNSEFTEGWYGNDSAVSNAIELNKWLHFTVTYDHNNVCIYKNGTLIFTKQNDVIPEIKEDAEIKVNLANTWFLGDLRIYDHCLSKQEVKEISQGLLVHYPLNAVVNPNLISSDTQIKVSSENSTLILSPEQSFQEFQSLHNNFTSDDLGKTFTYSGIVTNVESTSSSGVQLMIHSTYSDGSYKQWYFGDDHSDAWGPGVKVGETKFLKGTFTLPIDRGDLTGIRFGFITGVTNETYTIKYNSLKVERSSQATSFSEPILYDESGYSNDLIPNNEFEIQDNSPRYNKALVFNGTNNYLTRPSLPADSIKTISFWVKGNKHEGGAATIFMDSANQKAAFFFYGTLGISSGLGLPRFSLNNYSNTDWNHIVIIYDNTPKVYVNGILETAGDPSDDSNHGNCLYIGCNNYLGTCGRFFDGQLSDFRIYTTCLSEKDILDLYHTAVNVDSNGNIHCYEFDESALNSVSKNGIITSNEFIENNLPSEYQQVEYLESTGTQYIDTNVSVTDDNYIKTTFYVINESNNVICGSSLENGYGLNYIGGQYGTSLNFRMLKSNGMCNITTTVGKHTAFISNDKVIFDNLVYDWNADNNNYGGTLLLFAGGYAARQFGKNRIYRFEIIDKIILIPCYRKSDHVAGMYDLVSGQFFTNSGTGEFITGECIGNSIEIYSNKIKTNQLIEI